MRNIFERFFGFPLGISSELFLRLDRNFQKVALTMTSPLSISGGFTFTNTDQVDSLQVDAMSAALTIYLPEQPVGNRRRRIIKTDSSTNTVTIDGNGSLINDSSTYVLASQYDRLWVEPTGTGWLIIN